MVKTLKEKITTGAIITLAPLALTSFLFGFEPQITRTWAYDGKVQQPSFEEYRQECHIVNGEEILSQALTYITYPGAKAGVLVRNFLN